MLQMKISVVTPQGYRVVGTHQLVKKEQPLLISHTASYKSVAQKSDSVSTLNYSTISRKMEASTEMNEEKTEMGARK